MKNCEEMVSSLLRRRTEYEAKKRQRRQTVTRISSVACAMALVVFIGAGVDRGWWVTAEPELPTVTPTQNAAEPTPFQPTVEPAVTPTRLPVTEPTVTEPVAVNHIVVNELETIEGEQMYFALFVCDFIPMTEAELKDYYGTEFVPEVPEDLEELRRETALGIYRRDGGTGEVYHDEQKLTWTTEDYTRGISVNVNKGGLPYQFCVLLTPEETSVIRDVAVGIGRTAEGTWLAEFLYRDVGFRIIADGLSQEELVSVIESLIR